MRYIARWAATCILLITLLLVTQQVDATELVITPPRINEIYPNAPGSSESGFEFIELYNEATTEIDLSQYELRIKDKAKQMTLTGTLAADQYLAITTTFSLVNSGETIQLYYTNSTPETLLEEVEYSSGAADTESWSYFEDGWQLAPVTKDAANHKHGETVEDPIDICPATPEIDTDIPDGYEVDSDGECVAVVPTIECHNEVVINEILSDPNGLEADGGEFVELYNPALTSANLHGCELYSNKSSDPLVTFTEANTVQPDGYFVVEVTDKLTNSSGEVTFVTTDREDVVAYTSAKEGYAVAYFEDGWQNTNVLTPGAENMQSADDQSGSVDTTTSLAACPEGKFRNPETNRCKSISTASTSLTPCDPGQYRNPETNRCKKVSSSAASLKPCSPGQERNPETNRCRKVTSSSSDLKPCKDGYERNPDTNRCRKVTQTAANQFADAEDEAGDGIHMSSWLIAGVFSMAAGYGAYEYRGELGKVASKAKSVISKGKPPDL